MFLPAWLLALPALACEPLHLALDGSVMDPSGQPVSARTLARMWQDESFSAAVRDAAWRESPREVAGIGLSGGLTVLSLYPAGAVIVSGTGFAPAPSNAAAYQRGRTAAVLGAVSLTVGLGALTTHAVVRARHAASARAEPGRYLDKAALADRVDRWNLRCVPAPPLPAPALPAPAQASDAPSALPTPPPLPTPPTGG